MFPELTYKEARCAMDLLRTEGSELRFGIKELSLTPSLRRLYGGRIIYTNREVLFRADTEMAGFLDCVCDCELRAFVKFSHFNTDRRIGYYANEMIIKNGLEWPVDIVYLGRNKGRFNGHSLLDGRIMEILPGLVEDRYPYFNLKDKLLS